MSITAVIKKGTIKLPGNVPWKSGTVVRIEPVDMPRTCGELAEHWKTLDKLPPDEADAFADDIEKSRPGLSSLKSAWD